MAKRYLVVGINDYSGLDPTGSSNLTSCVNDANSIKDMLEMAFGFNTIESQILTDQQANADAILASLNTIITKSQAGDVVCFYYSGHGSRQPADASKPDCDTFYESIVSSSGVVITDKDLFSIYNSLQPSEVNFNVILDSCHSGGMDQETDTGFKYKSPKILDIELPDSGDQSLTIIPCGICIGDNIFECENNVTAHPSAKFGFPYLSEDPDKVLIDSAKMVLIAGCKFDELSWEISGHGLLTKAFLDIVNASNFQISYNDLIDQLKTNVTNNFNSLILPSMSTYDPKSQTPQLRGQKNRMSEYFLAGYADSR